jgi:hypothetical protein
VARCSPQKFRPSQQGHLTETSALDAFDVSENMDGARFCFDDPVVEPVESDPKGELPLHPNAPPSAVDAGISGFKCPEPRVIEVALR